MRIPTKTRAAVAALAALAIAGCAATSPEHAANADEVRCVVSTEPQMRLVTFAPKTGLDGGVTSVFFAQMPAVNPGDLVRLGAGATQGGPKVAMLEKGAESCAEVSHAAAGHH